MPALLFFLRDALVAKRIDLPDECDVTVRRGPPGEVSLGQRDGRYEIHVGSAALSEAHCALEVRGGAVRVTDVGSRNGTLVRVTPGVPVALDGSVLQLGAEVWLRDADARWHLPSAVVAGGPWALCAWVNEHLGASGQRVSLGAPRASSLPLVGDGRHVVPEAATAGGTFDVHDGDWLRWLVGRYNVERATHGEGAAWRFTAVSPGRRRALEQARLAAPTMLPVLLVGPTGVGKDVLAQDIHEHSGRRGGAFVAVNCAMLGAERLEGALFGHVRGAFPGAHADVAGLVEAAHQGTLFLDELMELPPAAQAGLLRFLESEHGEYRRMGDARVRRAQVRVIAATNRDPEDAARLRADLYFRLAGVRVDVPVLAGADASAVAAQLLRSAAERAGMALDASDYAFVERAAGASAWPGGARQLRHQIEQAVQMRGPGARIEASWPRRALQAPSAVAKAATVAPTAYSPTQVGRWMADATFLLAARSAKGRADLAARTQMTWQGADQRLTAMGVTLGDAAALEARFEATLAELRAMVRAEPGLRSIVAALLETAE